MPAGSRDRAVYKIVIFMFLHLANHYGLEPLLSAALLQREHMPSMHSW